MSRVLRRLRLAVLSAMLWCCLALAAQAQGLAEAPASADRAQTRPAVTGLHGLVAAGQTFVDMDPLKATRLPLIARLFPEARILIMRRDPRDVVLSCFRNSFALTSAALEFTSLERTARHYDAMMRLIEAARERLPLAFHEVDYHAMVRDFDGTTRALCAFLDLPWNESLRRFDRTARERGVATASASQVRRGLYDGRGQWEPFARYIEPVLPILQPWIDKFGYA